MVHHRPHGRADRGPGAVARTAARHGHDPLAGPRRDRSAGLDVLLAPPQLGRDPRGPVGPGGRSRPPPPRRTRSWPRRSTFPWPATSARVEPQSDGTLAWRAGFFTPEKEYAAVLQRGGSPTQAGKSQQEWIEAETRNGVAGGTVTIGGREWTRMEGDPTPDDRRSLVLVEDGTDDARDRLGVRGQSWRRWPGHALRSRAEVTPARVPGRQTRPCCLDPFPGPVEVRLADVGQGGAALPERQGHLEVDGARLELGHDLVQGRPGLLVAQAGEVLGVPARQGRAGLGHDADATSVTSARK